MIQRQRVKKVLVAVVTVLISALVWTEMTSEELEVDVEVEVEVETMCKCKRRQLNKSLKTNFSDTMCGLDAWKRGGGQKVVGFSLYEAKEGGGEMRRSELERNGSFSLPAYYDGLEENIQLCEIYYPGWQLRVYHDLSQTDPLLGDLCRLSCKYRSLDLCDVRDLPNKQIGDPVQLFPMLWRFFPTLDPQVDLFVSRDLDSLPTRREAAAVEEWLQSEKWLHAMRDNPYHWVPMLGGGWGSQLTVPGSRHKWKEIWPKILSDNSAKASRTEKGVDQAILAAYVWSQLGGADEAFQHDSYTCRHFPGSVGWPTQREHGIKNFFGAIGGLTLEMECPQECRRKDHADWTFC